MPHSAVVQTEAYRTVGQNLTVAALGVVYGDIGTSPLYTVKQCFPDAASVSETARLRRSVADRLGADFGGHGQVRASS